MSIEEKHHIVSYRSYLLILLGLISLTLISVGITHIELREYTVAGALILASIKSYFVLNYFMHLKYEKPMFRRMAIFVFLLFFAVIITTFIDYLYR